MLDQVQFTDTNHRGETEVRSVVPIRWFFGSTAHHPAPQWFMHAFCLSRQQTRDFAMQHVSGWKRLVDSEEGTPEKRSKT
jgi:predicted DNA-binding transcriptional regulator YafY